MATEPTIYNTRYAPFVGKVLTVQSSPVVVADMSQVVARLDALLIQQRLTNLYLSLMATPQETEFTIDDLNEEEVLDA